MKHITGPALCLALLGAAGSTALAGPHAGGTLILHSNPSLVYCTDTTDYCGQSALTSCEAAVNEKDGPDPALIFAIAAFPPESQPRLRGITFGLSYPDGVSLAGLGTCGDFELATTNWPASGEGTAVTWNSARTDHLIDVYWFAGYNYYSPTPVVLSLEPHPTQGANFADDSVPSILDPIAALGTFGFDTPGTTPCPTAGATGACCSSDGSCSVSTETDCTDAGGTFQGPGTTCDPNPCEQPVGACCSADGTCTLSSESDCTAAGGTYQGPGTTCDPNPCTQPLGACCTDTTCTVSTESDCTDGGGTFLGSGTACDPNPCALPLGACCMDDGSCSMLGESDCMNAGGTFQGTGTSCDPNPCAQPLTGACCFASGLCQTLTESDCTSGGGVYQGDNSVCDPNPCTLVPTKPTTWGAIKHNYR